MSKKTMNFSNINLICTTGYLKNDYISKNYLLYFALLHYLVTIKILQILIQILLNNSFKTLPLFSIPVASARKESKIDFFNI